MMKQKAFKIERNGLYQDFQNLKKILINSFSNQLLYSLTRHKSITKEVTKNAHFLLGFYFLEKILIKAIKFTYLTWFLWRTMGF